MNLINKSLLCLSISVLPTGTRAATVKLGDNSGNPPGFNAIDIQATRSAPSQVASGNTSLALGGSNTSTGYQSIGIGYGNLTNGEVALNMGFDNQNYSDFSVSIGSWNTVRGTDNMTLGMYNNIDYGARYSVSVGQGNVVTGTSAYTFGAGNTVSGESSLAVGSGNAVGFFSLAVGASNQVGAGRGYAFGSNNTVSSFEAESYVPSIAVGYFNNITSQGKFSHAFGASNTISATQASVFGTGITNSVVGSTMIGPSDTAKITILSSGNVGIGTSSPTSKLQVVGNLNVSGTITNPGLAALNPTVGSASNLRVGGTANPGSDWQGGTTVIGSDNRNKIVAGYLAGSTNGAVIGARNTTLGSWADLNMAGSNLIFRSNEIERMRVTSTGNVGVGTGAPGAKLHVASTGSTSDRGFRITATGTGADNYAEAQFAANGREFRIGTGGSGNNIGLANKFYVLDGTANAARVVLDANGNLGLGTTAPAAKLDVNGAVNISGDVKVKNRAIIRVSPAGDLGMGQFFSGIDPEY